MTPNLQIQLCRAFKEPTKVSTEVNGHLRAGPFKFGATAIPSVLGFPVKGAQEYL